MQMHVAGQIKTPQGKRRWCLDDANEGLASAFFVFLLIKCVVSLIIPGNSREALMSRFLFH